MCDVVQWPGIVPQTSRFGISGAGVIEADWGDACNIAENPGQQYAIHVGDLDQLRATGTYTHSPAAGLCNRTSPSTFAYGAGNEYYLIVPNDSGREGGVGVDSQGNPRPVVSPVCGLSRVETCD